MNTITVITLGGIVQELLGLPEGYDYEKIVLDDDCNCICLSQDWEQIPYEWDGKTWCLSCGNLITREAV